MGVGFGIGETSGVILGCTVEVSSVSCLHVYLLVLKAGPPVFETDIILMGTEVV